jgi:UDP-N-acetylmuramoyl-L-alanyl-D-glutamate--2,6-diaminopimelate ligase
VGVPVKVVPCARRALAKLAATFHGHPGERVRTVGVTGTKGKTTTTYLLRAILQQSGRECGLLGGIACQAFGESRPSRVTTPDPVAIQSFLETLDRPDGGFAAMEVSSHALVQHRVADLPFAVAVFTNLSGEHLDYHGSMARYLEAKAQLFDGLRPSAVAVLNASQEKVLPRLEQTPARVLYYGVEEDNDAWPRRGETAAPAPPRPLDVWASEVVTGRDGSVFRLHIRGEGPVGVRLHLLGRHNVENAVAAAAAAHALGIGGGTIRAGLATVRSVPGRLEPVEQSQPFSVVVDYAHTDDALEKALSTLRLLAGGHQVVCLFGCGGDRDRTKRARMAMVAERLADRVILTSDNPRTEDPDRIIEDVLEGFHRPDEVVVESDRRRAIALALRWAGPGDVVLLAGKGHETCQIVGTTRHDFDDRAVARELLVEQEGRWERRAHRRRLRSFDLGMRRTHDRAPLRASPYFWAQTRGVSGR